MRMRGLTLIELLVALAICAFGIAGVYRLFIAQSKAYVVQEQVVEVQQTIRTAMEMMVRDVRMVGFDYDNSTSQVRLEDYKPRPPYLISGNSITVWYEHHRQDPQGAQTISEIHAVRYALNGSNLERQLTVNGNQQPTEVLLGNVVSFQLTCGLDGRIGSEETQDGVVNGWVDCGTVNNDQDKVIAVRITLTTRPEEASPEDDRSRGISPRTLTSTVALRNLTLKKL